MKPSNIVDTLLTKNTLILLQVPESIYNFVSRDSKLAEDFEIGKIVIERSKDSDSLELVIKRDLLPKDLSHNFSL